MKVTVLKPFRDKNTGELFFPGRTLDLSDDRYEEITDKLGPGYLYSDAILEQEPEPEPEPEQEGADEPKKRGRKPLGG